MILPMGFFNSKSKNPRRVGGIGNAFFIDPSTNKLSIRFRTAVIGFLTPIPLFECITVRPLGTTVRAFVRPMITSPLGIIYIG
jgi:hypothetical protein